MKVSARSPTVRAFIGGFLYFEGLIVLAVGLLLVAAYWPPLAVDGRARNPVALVGMFITLAAVGYLILVGGILFLYHLKNPNREGKFAQDPRWYRLRRYQNLRRRGDVIFDEEIVSADTARDAYEIRRIMRD